MSFTEFFRRSSRRTRTLNHSIDSLEARTLLAIVNVVVDGNRSAPNVRITGSTGEDDIRLRNYNLGSDGNQTSTFNVTEFGVPLGVRNNYVIPHGAGGLTQLSVAPGLGNDEFSLDSMSITLLYYRDGLSVQESNIVHIGSFASAGDQAFIHSADFGFNLGSASIDVSTGFNANPSNLVVNYFKAVYTNTRNSATQIYAINGGVIRIGNLSVASNGVGSEDIVLLAASTSPDVQPLVNSFVQVNGLCNISTGGGVDHVVFDGNVHMVGFTTLDTGAGLDTVETGLQPTVVGPLAPIFDHLRISTLAGNDVVDLQDTTITKTLNLNTGNDTDHVFLTRCKILGGSIIDLGTAVANVNGDRNRFLCMSSVVSGTMFVLSSGNSEINFGGTQNRPLDMKNVFVLASSGRVNLGLTDFGQDLVQGTIFHAYVFGTGLAPLLVGRSGRVILTTGLSLSNAMLV